MVFVPDAGVMSREYKREVAAWGPPVNPESQKSVSFPFSERRRGERQEMLDGVSFLAEQATETESRTESSMSSVGGGSVISHIPEGRLVQYFIPSRR